MPNDVDSPYARDWSAGAFAPPGVIWVGDIPLDRARELVDEGWQVVGQPLPPLAPLPSGDFAPPVEAGPPPVDVVPAQGGPEERTPPDFDIPLPSEAPPGQVPQPVAPPLEGVLVNPDTVYHDYEGYDQLPGFGEPYTPPRRIIEGETEKPPWWVGPLARRAGRMVLGPYGAVLGQVIEAMGPEILGSGELPLPPIPPVFIPAPVVSLPSSVASRELTPPVPELQRPPVPDVVDVTAPAPRPLPVPRSSQTLPRAIAIPSLIGLGSIFAPILRPIHRGRSTPSQGFASNLISAPEVNVPTPLPRSIVDPLTPPLPAYGTDPLTPPRELPVPSPQTSSAGAPFFASAQPTDEDNDRCRCKKNQKHEEDPSNVIANVKVYKRRMSNWSLKNLNRGSKAAKLTNLARKFL